MKLFISWIGRKALSGIVTAIFFILTILGIAYAAISWPTGNPGGSEVDGGHFKIYFNNMFAGCTGTGVIQKFDSQGNAVCVSAGGGGVGQVGQSWVVVTGSRAAGTSYTNDTSSPIMANVRGGGGPGATFMCFVDGVQIGYSYGTNSGGDSDVHYNTVSSVIPVGSTYKCTGNISYWVELR